MIRFDSVTLTYVGLVLAARDLHPLKQWLTARCPECHQEPPVDDPCHVMLRGYVAVSCAGGLLVNPNMLGMRVPDWPDWRRVRPDVTIGRWQSAGEPDSLTVRAKAVITVELLTQAGQPFGSVGPDLVRLLHGQEFEVQSDPTDDPNGYQTITIIALR
ncbi:hypothetical protein [Nonomuraea angiospora]|uniref:hypothetical protein n=1 Tax=Nonomuraea angiospora TaxID=46172 RepID=UPI0029B5A478|nr:hypothetical protein [Nonomuraea angiospora]MDX3100485.1 hypothetical protein [Nonomuraea angiospora]